jgi:putative endonuclease
MQYTVYVIRSRVDGRLYKGLAKDVNIRLSEHNSGRNFSTKPYVPWDIVYTKAFDDLHDARMWEKYLKSGSGREYLKEILSNTSR